MNICNYPGTCPFNFTDCQYCSYHSTEETKN